MKRQVLIVFLTALTACAEKEGDSSLNASGGKIKSVELLIEEPKLDVLGEVVSFQVKIYPSVKDCKNTSKANLASTPRSPEPLYPPNIKPRKRPVVDEVVTGTSTGACVPSATQRCPFEAAPPCPDRIGLPIREKTIPFSGAKTHRLDNVPLGSYQITAALLDNKGREVYQGTITQTFEQQNRQKLQLRYAPVQDYGSSSTRVRSEFLNP